MSTDVSEAKVGATRELTISWRDIVQLTTPWHLRRDQREGYLISQAHLIADSVRPGSDRAQATFRPDGQDLLELVNSRCVHVDLYKRQRCLELSASKYLRNGRYSFMA